jgi:hypothetical protein
MTSSTGRLFVWGLSALAAALVAELVMPSIFVEVEFTALC